MWIRKLYQALCDAVVPSAASATTLPASFDAGMAEIAPILGISPEELERDRLLRMKRRALDAMEEALRLKEREDELRRRARALQNPPT